MLTQNRSLAQLTRRLSAASAVQAAAARPRSIAMPNGRELRLLQHFFDEAPVEQPRRHPRRADLTGMKVWPTAVKMLEQLQRPGSLLETLVGAAERPLRILELGAGTGVLGLGLAMLCERSHVVLTDPNLDVNWSETESGSSLEWLQANVDLNRKSFDALGVRVEARALEWSSDEHINALLDEHRGEDTFDLIVGSELLYDSDNYSPLLDVLARVDAASSRASSSGGEAAMAVAPVALLGYTRRHGGEERFLKQAMGVFAQVETRHFERNEHSSPWAMTTLRGSSRRRSSGIAASPRRGMRTLTSSSSSSTSPTSTFSSSSSLQQRRSRGMCTASSSAAPSWEASHIDAALTPPLHLSQEEQLAKLHADDAARGRRQMQLPPLNDKGEMAYTGWGEYFVKRQWGEAGNDLNDRLLLQSITGALSCVLTTHAACSTFHLDASEQLVCHVVGAADTNEGALLGSGWVWEELCELMPFTAVHLALIGPDLTSGDRGVERLSDRLTVETHGLPYLEWLDVSAAGGKQPAPDVVLAFNSGCGTDCEQWRGSLERVLDERIPLVCTSFDEEDAEADAGFLDELDANLIIRQRRNPFAAALPEQRTGRQGEAQAAAPADFLAKYGAPLLKPRVGYSNAYWHIARGRNPRR